jgi:phospholipase C
VVSPWSAGGWVCSETFDHTSLIRLIEARFGVSEPNITPWRRAVCGDLTSAFDFDRVSDQFPALPSTAAYKPTGAGGPTYYPTPPASGSVPIQEPGVRPSRRLGYRVHVAFNADPQKLSLSVKNNGSLGVHLQARSLTVAGAPYSYTIGAGDELAIALANPGAYDLSVHGPNGFFRHFAGSPATALQVEVHGDHDAGKLRLRLTDRGNRPGVGRHRRPVVLDVADAYGTDHQIELNGSGQITIDTRHSGGWYDIALTTQSDASFSYQLAGRLESGDRLTSDPQFGRS